MPDLSKQITDYVPEPDPMQQLEQQTMQADIQLKQIQMQEAMANIQLVQAQIQRELANSRKLGTEANLNELEFVETESGVTQERELELQKAQSAGNLQRDITNNILNAKLNPNKETPNE